MLNFQLAQPVNVLFGAGSVAQAGELLQGLGLKKAFLVCDEGVQKAGIVDRVQKSIQEAGLESVVYDKVLADPPAAIVDAGIAAYRREGCDAILAVGGGSSIDTAKGINILRYNEGPILRFADFSAEMQPSPGLIAIPTTAGTGSEMSDGLVITGDDHVKHPILANKAMTSYAIVDPQLMTGMPPHLTASTGMDALCHALESYTSSAANMLTDQICEGNISSILRWLPRAVADGSDLEARSHMAAASSISGWMLCYGHTHAGHSVAHILGAEYGIPHGFACAYAEPWVLEFNAPAMPQKTKQIGEWLGASFQGGETPEEIGRITRDAFIHFRDNVLGIRPATDFSHDPAGYPTISEEIAAEMFQAFNPRKMEPADALAIVKRIFGE